MSKTLIRYLAYDRCLQNRGFKYTWQDLQKAANQDLEDRDYQPIGKTQFFQDIKDLKGTPYLAPIEPRFCSRTIQSDLVAGLFFGHLRIIHHTIAFF